MSAHRIFALLFAALLAACAGPTDRTSETANTNVNTTASANQSANNLWFIFLESGKKTPDDKDAVAKMQRGHIDNFKRLFGEKKLFAAGPLRDPSGLKRGIVVVKANGRDELSVHFQPDEYVRDGYMTLNATLAAANKPLATEGIDENAIEEVRIVQIMRPRGAGGALPVKANRAFIQSLVDKGTIGAWYTLQTGPVAEVLFAKTKDTAALETALADYPSAQSGGAEIFVWGQWLAKGVVK
jgi:uncharacterized protein YciI